MLREQSSGAVISHATQRKSFCFVEQLLNTNTLEKNQSNTLEKKQSENTLILSNIVIHSAVETICGFWTLKKDQDLCMFVLNSSKTSITEGLQPLLLTQFIVSMSIHSFRTT